MLTSATDCDVWQEKFQQVELSPPGRDVVGVVAAAVAAVVVAVAAAGGGGAEVFAAFSGDTARRRRKAWRRESLARPRKKQRARGSAERGLVSWDQKQQVERVVAGGDGGESN